MDIPINNLMSSSLVNVSAAICKASSSPEVNLSFNILDKKIPGKSKTLLKIKLNSGIFSKAIHGNPVLHFLLYGRNKGSVFGSKSLEKTQLEVSYEIHDVVSKIRRTKSYQR